MNEIAYASAGTVRERTTEDGTWTRMTDYFGDWTKLTDGPQAFLVERRPAEAVVTDGEAWMTKPHFHRVRQFQLIVRGDRARVGKHPAPPVSFHYTDPSSPYGPIVAGAEGIAFFTLRPRADIGGYFMPGAREKMRARAGRNVVVNVAPSTVAGASAGTETLIERTDDGLAAYRMRIPADASAWPPDARASGGQFVYVLAGGPVADDGVLGWIGPDTPPAPLTAGPEGADLLIMQFPLPQPELEAIDLGEVAPEYVALSQR
jgi:hypothetical protein